ncbi:Hypothetical predicted protein [Octopus vulgaris]|uniref:Uncharacterized protein n=1 Tax=Octopus vulgaris TaxID=6645 RepID=A0AA36AQZ1_OCTVU|nr:Hypothetical predicted protein [Octopus vulgaris]
MKGMPYKVEDIIVRLCLQQSISNLGILEANSYQHATVVGIVVVAIIIAAAASSLDEAVPIAVNAADSV